VANERWRASQRTNRCMIEVAKDTQEHRQRTEGKMGWLSDLIDAIRNNPKAEIPAELIAEIEAKIPAAERPELEGLCKKLLVVESLKPYDCLPDE
jgi:hypothetical protein